MKPNLSAPVCTLLMTTLLLTACSDKQEATETVTAPVEQNTVKNLLLVCIDTVRADTFAAVGELRNDRLRAWEERGLVFSRAYAPSPWTVPSVASAFTGLWPNQHGAGLIAGFNEITIARTPPNALLPQARTLAEEARDNGFKTAMISASHWTFGPNSVDINRGFQTYDKWEPTLQTLDASHWEEMIARWQERNAERGDTRSINFLQLLEAHNWHFVGDRKLEKRLASFTPEQRALYRATAPERACEDEDSMYCKRYLVYAHAVGVMRDAVANMLNILESDGLLKETAVVVFADHGEEFNDHGDDGRVQVFKPPRWPYMGHGGTLYEEQLHVPLIVWHPNIEGEVIDNPVSLIDIGPSAAAWLGLDFKPAGSEARMLHEQLASYGDPDERPLFASHVADGEKQVSARLGKTKSIWYLPTDRTLFYDLGTDPDELAPSQEGNQVMLFDSLYLEYEEMKASEQIRAASFTEEQLKGLQAIGYLQGVDSTEELESNSETETGRGLNNDPEPDGAEQR